MHGKAPAEDDLDALADVFLEHPDVRAAREVRERGPWALTRAIQLAEKVLAQAETRPVESPSLTRSVSRRRRG